MSEYQTTVTALNLIRGSGKLEVAAYTTGDPSWVDVGGITGLSVVENLTIANEEYDNAVPSKTVSKQELVVSGVQLEILNLDVWEIIRGDLDTIVQESQTSKIQSGDKSVLPNFMVRVTTKNDDNGSIYLIGYYCNINKGFEFAYQKDDGEDRRLQNSFEFVGRGDPGRGSKVYELEGPFNG